MPFINVYTSAEPPAEDAVTELLTTLSRALAKHLGKPESYVMTCLVPRSRMTFGGTFAPACYAEVKNVGSLDETLAEAMSRDLCARLATAFGVSSERVYIEFTEAEGRLWGYAGSTFA
jgi:phenylpyruvate tautomerase PptA (4-oxalocrotonate tautomerase family)